MKNEYAVTKKMYQSWLTESGFHGRGLALCISFCSLAALSVLMVLTHPFEAYSLFYIGAFICCIYMFGIGNRDVPEKIREAKLSKWYGTLSDTDKVKLNRYMDGADPSSASAFICSVSKLANDDHNYKFVAFLAESTEDIRMDGIFSAAIKL